MHKPCWISLIVSEQATYSQILKNYQKTTKIHASALKSAHFLFILFYYIYYSHIYCVLFFNGVSFIEYMYISNNLE